jgi:hypothetical protein
MPPVLHGIFKKASNQTSWALPRIQPIDMPAEKIPKQVHASTTVM